MKNILLLLICFCCSLFTYADTEPDNDTPVGADTIAQNGNVSGTITAGNYDFYELNTSGDGNVTVTLDAVTSSYMYVRLYDSSGTQVLGSVTANSGGGPVSFTAYQLGAGKYYITTQGNGSDSYTVSNTVDLLATPNDLEPNDSYATAIPIIVDDSTRGHLTYRNPNGTYDSNDYYKMTIPVDGDITVTISNNNGASININLFDSVGQSNIGAGGGAGAGSFTSSALGAGTYYIKVSSFLTGDYSGYNLSYHLTPTSYDNDIEPNDIFSDASIINVSDSTTGHLMHRLPGGNYDIRDWYQIVTTTDGDLTFSIFNSTNNYIGLALYDSTSLNWIGNTGGPGQSGLSIAAFGLPAGRYYIKVDAFQASDFCGYILRNIFIINGINDLTSITDFKVFPNPATDRISLKYSSILSGEHFLKIVDATGRVCFERKVFSNIGFNNVEIPVQDLPKGIYVLKLISGIGSKQSIFSKD